MGQALRRVSGRVRPSASASSPAPANRAAEPPPVTDGFARPAQDRVKVFDSEATSSRKDVDNDDRALERDPNYDKMLSHMVGKITSKPGGALEMGEASIGRYDRSLPKVRSSKVEVPGGSAQKPLPAGTLNIQQIHQIILLHQGKSDGQDRPVGIQEISERFKVDQNVVQKIVQSLSLPQEEKNNDEKLE